MGPYSNSPPPRRWQLMVAECEAAGGAGRGDTGLVSEYGYEYVSWGGGATVLVLSEAELVLVLELPPR